MTLRARLDRLEWELRPYESEAQRYSRELLTPWLATCDQGAELWAEYEDTRQSFGVTGMLRTKAGRDLTMRLLDDLYEQLEPKSLFRKLA